MSLKRRITPWLASRDVKDQQFTSVDRFSAFKNDGSCPAVSRPQPAMELQKEHSFVLLSRSSLFLPSLLSLSFSPSPFGFRTIGVERRNGRSLEQRRDETRKRKRRRGRERTSVMTGRRKNSQLTLASRCRVGVIGFAENFYVFSRHLHNVRGEHGRSIG